jgi:hypothetical protein
LAEELRTVDVVRPGAGKRYTSLPVDHVDVTGFHTDYEGSPLRPQLLDIRPGDQIFWFDDGSRFQARVDEVVVDNMLLRVAFTDAASAPPEW